MHASRPSIEARQLRDLAGLAVLGAVLLPARLVGGGPVICPFRRATGLPCPACGLTRSWNAAARLDVRRSVADHPLGPATLVLATATALAGDDGAAILPTPPRAVQAALVVAWLGVWIARLARARHARARAAIP